MTTVTMNGVSGERNDRYQTLSEGFARWSPVVQKLHGRLGDLGQRLSAHAEKLGPPRPLPEDVVRLRVKRIDGVSGLVAFSAEIDRLNAASARPNPFCSSAFLGTYAKNCEDHPEGVDVRLFLVEDGERIIAALPLRHVLDGFVKVAGTEIVPRASAGTAGNTRQRAARHRLHRSRRGTRRSRADRSFDSARGGLGHRGALRPTLGQRASPSRARGGEPHVSRAGHTGRADQRSHPHLAGPERLFSITREEDAFEHQPPGSPALRVR